MVMWGQRWISGYREARISALRVLLEQSHKLVFAILLGVLSSACGNPGSVPAVPSHGLPTPTMAIPPLTQAPAISAVSIPSFSQTITPDLCNAALSKDKIQVISNDLLTALGPGGPVAFDRILVEQNPAWAAFRQYDHGEMRTAGVVFHETAFGTEHGTGINPAVILVIYGVERNWGLPATGDLVSEVDRIRAALDGYRLEWVRGQVDQSQYPTVANGGTSILYRYFDGDLTKLEDWCQAYMQVFNESPLE